MPDELESPLEFHVAVTELRDSLGFTVREVANSGNPVIVSRYGVRRSNSLILRYIVRSPMPSSLAASSRLPPVSSSARVM